MMTSATPVQLRKPRTDSSPLWDVVLGLLPQRTLLLAYDLKLFPFLAEQPHSIAEIGVAFQLDDRAVFAILSVLRSIGLVTEQAGQYSLTPLAEDYCLESSPTYLGGYLDWVIGRDSLVSFANFKESILSGGKTVDRGEEFFNAFAEQATLARSFSYAMHGHSMGSALAWPELIDLSQYKRFLDIGGGSGAHAISAVHQWPNLQATVLDLPAVCEVAQEFISRYGLDSQINTHSSDIWQEPFPVADVHFYADIYHDWSPEQGRFLTQKSFDRLPSGGRLIIHEMLYNDSKSGPLTVANYNLGMLLSMKGQQYSGRELSTLLSKVGFLDVEVIPTTGYWSIVTGCKP
ncbi:methyltransferase [Roseofilum casamattae]|uniref:Methyltransferase n=1 Tax=Roseofilum casamattae BLCC-M143 TaxID=3022442 RepID=A0ABT7BSZ9_9CYAN|nr:methyltransferase [Roseofilum casamattae]MDJ1182304.1 methyltransferase [Roseofilum casamattae BLCC-M143]